MRHTHKNVCQRIRAFKRDLFIWQKRPTHMAKETYSYGKRDLFISASALQRLPISSPCGRMHVLTKALTSCECLPAHPRCSVSLISSPCGRTISLLFLALCLPNPLRSLWEEG